MRVKGPEWIIDVHAQPTTQVKIICRDGRVVCHVVTLQASACTTEIFYMHDEFEFEICQEFYGKGKHRVETCTNLRSHIIYYNSMECLKFLIPTGYAWDHDRALTF